MYGERGEIYSHQQAGAAIQNMLLTATSLGIDSCWVGAFDEDMIKRVLGIQEYARPQAIIPIGYAAESPPDPIEYTLENLMYLNKWKTGCTVVKEPDIVCAYYSKITEQRIDEAKDLIQNAFGKGKESLQKMQQKAQQKLAEKKEKKEEKEEKESDAPLDSDRTSWITR